MKTKKLLPILFSGMSLLPIVSGNLHAQSLSGSCSGTVVQNLPAPYNYTINVHLQGATGTISYPTFGCTGTLTFIKADDSVYWYKEHAAGASAKCGEGGTVEIVLEKNTIHWLWYLEGMIAVGNLNGKLSVTGIPTHRVPVGQEGFTNRAEAKNQTINGLREGKWIVFEDSSWHETKDTNMAGYYRLVGYKNGKSLGITRDYYRATGRLQNEYVFTLNGLENGISRWYLETGEMDEIGSKTDSVFEGPFIRFFSSGFPSEVSFYKNGKRAQIGTWFYDSGTIYSVIPHLNGKREGSAKWYYRNGKEKSEEIYSAGLLNGAYKHYNENGTLITESSYVNGQLNGTEKIYKDNGKLDEVSNYKDGELDGTTYLYHDNGNIDAELVYSSGKLSGLSKVYFESGKLEAEKYYTDDKKNGTAKWYFESGNLKEQATYSDDKLNGEAKWYFEAGALNKTAYYQDDRLNGTASWYYESGVLQEESSYTDDVLNGWTKWYYESGKLKEECYYTNGSAGQTYYWDENGNQLQ